MRQADRWRGGAIWYEDYEKLLSQRADILVVHEAPSTHHYGARAIDDLAVAMGVQLIVHGHHHVTYVAQINEIRVHGIDAAVVMDLHGQVVAEIPPSARRRTRKR